jgi:hypothetical protein
MLSKEAFMDAIFELADVWTADTSETTYRNFIESLFLQLTDGRTPPRFLDYDKIKIGQGRLLSECAKLSIAPELIGNTRWLSQRRKHTPVVEEEPPPGWKEDADEEGGGRRKKWPKKRARRRQWDQHQQPAAEGEQQAAGEGSKVTTMYLPGSFRTRASEPEHCCCCCC